MDYIKFEITDGIARITLNRPETLNSFNRQMALELQAVLDQCAEDKTVRALYLTGEGRAFCAGQDLGEAVDDNGLDIGTIVKEHYNPIVTKIRNIEKPVVCAVNGVAAGAGANIALACDITFAAESVSFIQSFSNISLIPDSGGTFTLPRLVGMQRASAMAFLAEKISATEAAQMGLIYRVVADDHLHELAGKTTARLAKMPTKGIGLTKKCFNASWKNSFEEQLQVEGKAQIEAADSHDFNEGVQAFLEKRKPVFKGE